jgi:hypothetical protein
VAQRGRTWAAAGTRSIGGRMEFCHKRLLNGTKPIYVENKGSLEEQTQTKPKTKPIYALKSLIPGKIADVFGRPIRRTCTKQMAWRSSPAAESCKLLSPAPVRACLSGAATVASTSRDGSRLVLEHYRKEAGHAIRMADIGAVRGTAGRTARPGLGVRQGRRGTCSWRFGRTHRARRDPCATRGSCAGAPSTQPLGSLSPSCIQVAKRDVSVVIVTRRYRNPRTDRKDMSFAVVAVEKTHRAIGPEEIGIACLSRM